MSVRPSCRSSYSICQGFVQPAQPRRLATPIIRRSSARSINSPPKTAVISTINGESNVRVSKELGNQGLKAKDVPCVAFSVGEEVTRRRYQTPGGPSGGWEYIMSLKNPTKDEFTKKWGAYAKSTNLRRAQGQGTDQRSDGSGVCRHVHVEPGGGESQHHRSGKSDSRRRRPAVQGAAGFTIKMDEKNHHLHKPVFVGEVKGDGQFNVVWKTSGLIKAKP